MQLNRLAGSPSCEHVQDVGRVGNSLFMELGLFSKRELRPLYWRELWTRDGETLSERQILHKNGICIRMNVGSAGRLYVA